MSRADSQSVRRESLWLTLITHFSSILPFVLTMRERNVSVTVINDVRADIVSLTKQLQFTGWQIPKGRRLDKLSELVSLVGYIVWVFLNILLKNNYWTVFWYHLRSRWQSMECGYNWHEHLLILQVTNGWDNYWHYYGHSCLILRSCGRDVEALTLTKEVQWYKCISYFWQ